MEPSDNQGAEQIPPETPAQAPVQESDDWRSALTDELRDAPALKDVKDVGGLAKQFVDLQSYMGNVIRRPSTDATPEEYAAFVQKAAEASNGQLMVTPDLTQPEQSTDFFRSIGMPEKAEQYTIPSFGEGIEVNSEVIDSYRPILHEAGVTNSQFEKIVGKVVEMDLARNDAGNKAQEEDMRSLRQEWGQAYDQNVGIAVNLIEQMGGSAEMVEMFKNQGADSGSYKLFYNIAKQLGGEHSEIASQFGGAKLESPLELEARKDELMDRISVLDKEKTAPNRIKSAKLFKEVIQINEKLAASQQA